MKQFSARRLAADAMFAAMCTVLGFISLDLGHTKITFDSLPVLVGALMLGPWDGLAVGLIGTLIYQLLAYGVSATTALWILPYALAGLLAGALAARRSFTLSRRQLAAVIVLCELLITTLNTGVIYVDSHIYGYYTPAFILAPLPLRYAMCLVKAAAYSAVMPYLVGAARRAMRLDPSKGA